MVAKTLKQDLDASVLKLAKFLELNQRERIFEYPFGYSYPVNCCESVSLILIYLIDEKYGASNVRLIKGTKPKKHEHHLWVTVGDWVYDLTAHQFRNQKQIIGALFSPLHFRYKDWMIDKARDFVEREQVIALYRSGIIPF